MAAVQAQVLSHYRSDLVERIRSSGHVLSAGDLTIKLAKQFGFCYGVERAIDLAYAARKVFPQQPIYILGEIIHNPEVNDQIRAMGIKFLSGKEKDADIADLKKDDIVIIPAFGTEVSMRRQLEAKGCRFVDTTCGDVMSVWKRVRQYSKDKVTSIIHGKAWHEETKATSSQAMANGGGHYLVVFTLAETDYVCDYMVNGGDKAAFLEKFKGAYSDGFDPDIHLQAIGVANQTTMLRGETEEVQRRLRRAMVQKYGEAEIDRHFRFFDTICGATQDRQDALEKLLQEPHRPAAGHWRIQFLEHLASGGNGRGEAADLLYQERRQDAVGQVDSPLRPAQARGSRDAQLAAAGQDHRRHHRRRLLPEQPDRGRHPAAVRVAGDFRATTAGGLIGAGAPINSSLWARGPACPL